MRLITAPAAQQKNSLYDLIGSLRIITAKHSLGRAHRLLRSSRPGFYGDDVHCKCGTSTDSRCPAEAVVSSTLLLAAGSCG